MTSLSDLPLRQNLVGKTPYGAPQESVPIALNVNENTHGLPQHVVDDVAGSLADVVAGVNRYPDREFHELREALAGYLGHGITADEVWAANGSNEVLQQILQAFGGPGRSLLSFTPTYSMYPLLADGTDTDWIAVPRPADYVLTPEYVRAAITHHKPNLVVLCAPNNPTGTSMSLEVVKAAYDAFDGILIVDEAYQEFEEQSESALSLLSGRPRLIVSRTMSKAFAYAGVRLGYMAACPAVVDALRLVRLPYHLSALTQAAAVAALRHSSAMLAEVGEINRQKERLAKALTELGFFVWPSGTNFLLVGGFKNPRETFEKLYSEGILIRNLGIAGHLRITVGTEDETTAVIAAIEKQLPDALDTQLVEQLRESANKAKQEPAKFIPPVASKDEAAGADACTPSPAKSAEAGGKDSQATPRGPLESLPKPVLLQKYRLARNLAVLFAVIMLVLGGVAVAQQINLARQEGAGIAEAQDTAAEVSSTSGKQAACPVAARHDEHDPLALGKLDAPITLAEYLDFRCPYCGVYMRDIFPQLKQEYVQTGKVRVEVHPVSLIDGENSTRTAIAVLAAGGQGKLFEYMEAIYGDMQNSKPAITTELLLQYAKQAGVADLNKFEQDLASEELAQQVAESTETARANGVSGVPLVVNTADCTAVNGAQPLENFKSFIDSKLSAK